MKMGLVCVARKQSTDSPYSLDAHIEQHFNFHFRIGQKMRFDEIGIERSSEGIQEYEKRSASYLRYYGIEVVHDVPRVKPSGLAKGVAEHVLLQLFEVLWVGFHEEVSEHLRALLVSQSLCGIHGHKGDPGVPSSYRPVPA